MLFSNSDHVVSWFRACCFLVQIMLYPGFDHVFSMVQIMLFPWFRSCCFHGSDNVVFLVHIMLFSVSDHVVWGGHTVDTREARDLPAAGQGERLPPVPTHAPAANTGFLPVRTAHEGEK